MDRVEKIKEKGSARLRALLTDKGYARAVRRFFEDNKIESVVQKTFYKYLNGERAITAELAIEIEEKFKIPAAWIMGISDEREATPIADIRGSDRVYFNSELFKQWGVSPSKCEAVRAGRFVYLVDFSGPLDYEEYHMLVQYENGACSVLMGRRLPNGKPVARPVGSQELIPEDVWRKSFDSPMLRFGRLLARTEITA